LQDSVQNFQNFFRKERELAALRKEKFAVDLISPSVDVSEIELQFNRPFPMSGIAKHDVKVTYFPLEDAVCLEYRLNGYTYNQFWHRAGRESFVKALEEYKEDFSAQKLVNKNAKTRKQYGVIADSYLRWQSVKITTPSTGNMEMELGYYFREKSPFFAVTQLEAVFESPTLQNSQNRNSAEIPIFFTRTQADELASLFNQDYLLSITPELYLQIIQESQRRANASAPDIDEY
jgi:hypothetical protein